jgi:hypothetical protein
MCSDCNVISHENSEPRQALRRSLTLTLTSPVILAVEGKSETRIQRASYAPVADSQQSGRHYCFHSRGAAVIGLAH